MVQAPTLRWATERRKRRSGRRWLRHAWWWTWRLLVTALFLGWFFVLRIEERTSWPPPADAITSVQAQGATASFLARGDVSIQDLAIPWRLRRWRRSTSIQVDSSSSRR